VHRVLTYLAMSVLAAAPSEAPAPLVQCLRIGEGAEAGRLLAVRGGVLALQQQHGTAELPLDGFRELVFAPVSEPPLPPPFTAWTTDGRRLAVRRFASAPQAGTVGLVGYGWRAEGVPLGSLRAVAARSVLRGDAERREAFEQARDAPPAGEDLLTAARDGRRRLVPCVVEGLGPDGVVLSVADRRRTLDWGAVEWLVLSPTPGGPGGRRHFVMLTDGTGIALESFELADGRLSGVEGAAGWSVEAKRLARIRVGSDAYRYLSDLEPQSVVTTPLLDVVWPPRLDAAVTGSPLCLGGTTYAKGIGMHVRTEMTFALDGGYARFLAVAGVDDAADGLGAVVLRVVADGRTVFDSGERRGGQPALPVSVDVGGVRRLALVADTAGAAALSGQFADWAEARLIRGPCGPSDAPGRPDAR